MPKLISVIDVHKCHFVGFCFSAAHLWHFHLQWNRAPKNIMLNGPNDAFIAKYIVHNMSDTLIDHNKCKFILWKKNN